MTPRPTLSLALTAAVFLSLEGCSRDPKPASPEAAAEVARAPGPERAEVADAADASRRLGEAIAAYERERRGFVREDPHIATLLEPVAIEELSAGDFERMGVMLDLAPRPIRDRFRTRLVALARSSDAEGGVAATLLPRLVDAPAPDASALEAAAFHADRSKAIVEASKHPGIGPALRLGRGTSLHYIVYFHSSDDAVRNAGVSRKLADLVDDSWPLDRVDDLIAFTEAMTDPASGLEREVVDRLREVTTRVVERVLANPETGEATRDGLLGALKAINGLSARGELVGNEAPSLRFLWTSGERRIESLSDLRGSIVVLDFWATWCGPCIASFDELRALRERYADQPVTIVGVTALQGWILDPTMRDPAKRRIEGLSRDEEILRLGAWAKAMNMTWTVAVAEGPLFNREFGVRGIPTLVVVDARGVVALAGANPGDPGLIATIDALLAAGGSRTTPQPGPSAAPPPR